MTRTDKMNLEIGRAIEEAAEHLPDGWRVFLEIENGSAVVSLEGPDGMGAGFDQGEYLDQEIRNAVERAKELGS